MLDVKYSHLEMLRSVVKTAAECEKADHRKNADEKAASWLMKQAKDAELVMDDDLKHEVQTKLAGSKRTRKESSTGDEADEDDVDKPFFKVHDDEKVRERNRGAQRTQAEKQEVEKKRNTAMLK